jgi:benzoyl-CoA reductase/2-hydroxyglutaryl-CoA dehydratase subunit BcrC/BadD/HgdB
MQVFLTSPWVPAEWIKAHGLEPRGIWSAPQLGSDSLPLSAGLCAFANAVVDLAAKEPESAVVFSTHCDQLRRGFDALAGAASARAFLFNLPATWQTPVAGQMFASELERLGEFLVALGGHEPEPGELLETMTHYALARARLRAAAAGCTGRRYAQALAAFHWDGSCPESIQAPPRGEEGPSPRPWVPLALIGGPLPRAQWDLLDAIERAGGRVVLNGTEAGERSLGPAFPLEALRAALASGAGGREALVEALTRGYLEGCADVFQRPNTPLYAWLETRLQARGVRGIVLWHYVGCDLWRAEAQSLRQTLGLPVLALDAEEVPAGAVRDAVRLEAFLEALR